MKVSGKAKVSVCTILIIAAFLLTGCGNALEWAADDDSREARLETARMALDDRNYAEARHILYELNNRYPNDPEVSELLSNAYAGKAGLDTFALLGVIDDFGVEVKGSIDMVGRVLGGEDATLTADEITGKIGNLTYAIKALSDLEDAGLTLTYDQRIQRGLLSVNRAALTIAEIIMADISRDAGNIEIEHIELTEEGIRYLYHLYSDIYTINFRDIEKAITERRATLSADIKNVAESVIAIGKVIGGDELAENFKKFKNDVTDKYENITADSLEDYIGDILNRIVPT
ncbi:hypothetical protein M1N54_04685 [Thermodesulfovibrionales bacterium]|nr:hypothetical protein [Thermodesulfovibrionales bacterium]